jgi:hypothetical protein
MRDVTSDLQMEVEGLLAQPRGLLLIAREIVKRGDAAVACAVTLLDRRAQAPGADPFRNQELKVLIHALRHDRSQAEAEMKVLLGEGWKGVKGAGRLVITLAGRSEELDAAAHLLEVARAAAPKAYALERASALVEKRQAHKGAEERRREKRAERDDGEPGPEAQVLSAAKKAARALDWAEASELLDAADDSSRIREQKALAAVYESHQDPAGLTPRRLPSVDIRYINLDRDDARRTRIEGEFADCGLQLQRSAAVMGAALPAIVRERIITDAGFMDHGVLAVFLSHVRTWELVLASQRPCLILEDDARPIFRLGRVLEQLADEVEDLCFLRDGAPADAGRPIRRQSGRARRRRLSADALGSRQAAGVCF